MSTSGACRYVVFTFSFRNYKVCDQNLVVTSMHASCRLNCRLKLLWGRQAILECLMMRYVARTVYVFIKYEYMMIFHRLCSLQVRDFVSRYLPAYNAYLPTLYSEGPSGSDPQHLLNIEIDEKRNPILGV